MEFAPNLSRSPNSCKSHLPASCVVAAEPPVNLGPIRGCNDYLRGQTSSGRLANLPRVALSDHDSAKFPTTRPLPRGTLYPSLMQKALPTSARKINARPSSPGPSIQSVSPPFIVTRLRALRDLYPTQDHRFAACCNASPSLGRTSQTTLGINIRKKRPLKRNASTGSRMACMLKPSSPKQAGYCDHHGLRRRHATDAPAGKQCRVFRHTGRQAFAGGGGRQRGSLQSSGPQRRTSKSMSLGRLDPSPH
jgi:hypothetical protein